MNIHVKLLTRAKELINSGYERYICYALVRAEQSSEDVETKTRADLEDRIGRELGSYPYLDDWVRANAGIEMTLTKSALRAWPGWTTD